MFARQLTTVQRFKLDLPENEAIKILTAAYKAQVENRHCCFLEDENIIRAIEFTASWLTLDNKKPGLYFTGLCGTGKTTMIKAINMVVDWYYTNTRFRPMAIIKATDLASMAMNNYHEFKLLAKRTILAIDDLGQEPALISSYANIMKPCIEILSERYDAQLTTFISSNLAPENIKEYYDERLSDRFREMMEIIPFESKTFRK
jgi:DNA replication protein